MLKMLKRLIGENIKLDWRPGEQLWPVLVDPTQIDQILINLCVNASDAITGTGTIRIETGVIVLNEADISIAAEVVPGKYVQLAVSDDGKGMSTEVIEHLFEPFFTTKEMCKGPGLGLATVYGIVKQNHGYITVESELEQGSTFKICLPRHASTEPI
jgi:two-component system cell cycle sensor histidine kinase/response regulator CckA